MSRHGLDAREYKLLLSPEPFRDADPGNAIGADLEARLRRLAERHGVENLKKPKSAIELKHDQSRLVRFWDTSDGLLASHALSLRLRLPEQRSVARKGKAKGELTLKLRIPDSFVASASFLHTKCTCDTCKFEEDIAPLLVKSGETRGRDTPTVCMPKEPTIRSRYTRSCKASLDWDFGHLSLADVARVFDRLPCLLAKPKSKGVDRDASLGHRIVIREHVFSSRKVSFGDGIKGRITFTSWSRADNDEAIVAEISFDCKLIDTCAPERRMPPRAARRALMLFLAMQSEFRDVMHPTETSKTALAIPVPVGAP